MTTPTPPSDDRLWTIHDVAAYLAVSRRTVERLAAQPGFPPRIRLTGATHRWHPDDVRRWARSRRDRSASTHLVDALR